MGKLVNGQWQTGSIVSSDKSGAYDRQARTFLDTISPTHHKFTPDSGRYHLYVSYACPWAHRTLIMRQLKGLKPHISVDVVHPDMLENGWAFQQGFAGASGDSLYQKQFLYEVYQHAQPDLTSSVTVPVLWDKQHQTIVNNESSVIIRILNAAFNDLTGNQEDYYPEDLQSEIDALNEPIYHRINNGVYKAGFAKTQAAYDEAVDKLFDQLDHLEKRLGSNRFLCGDRLTEADIRLIPTLLRFDVVYHTHFKCNVHRIVDFPNLSRYTRRMYDLEAVKMTTHFDHIKRHYYYSHESINPYRIIPRGPADLL